MRRRIARALVVVLVGGLAGVTAAVHQFASARHFPAAVLPPHPLTIVSDARPVTVQTTTDDWRKVEVETTVDRLRTDQTLWRRMHLDDWDRVPEALREQALRNMLIAYAGVLQPRRWRDLQTADWDIVPQPIRAVAFMRMVWHWARVEALGAEFDMRPELLAQTVAAIVMAESWFEHRAVNENRWGNRDLGLAQCSDHCRETIREMVEAGVIDFDPRDEDYFNPLIGTRVATVWFERELLRSEGDVDLAIRAYHRGQDNALDPQGDTYFARVIRLRDRYITAQTASPSWQYLTAQVRETEASEATTGPPGTLAERCYHPPRPFHAAREAALAPGATMPQPSSSMWLRPLTALCTLTSLVGAASAVGAARPAQDVSPQPPMAATADRQPFVIEEMLSSYRFEADGTGERRYRVSVRINDQAGLARWGTLAFVYMSAVEEVSLRELVVEKPDGRRIEAKDAPLEDVVATGQVDEPIVSDWRAKKVAVPALQPGDRLRYDVAMRSSASLTPGHFWASHSFTRTAVVRDEILEVDAPLSRTLKVHARRGTSVPVSGVPDGRQVLRWRHQQDTPVEMPADDAAERAALEEAKLGPDVHVSSFESWTQLGDWFDALAASRSEPDDAVRARALSLTRDAKTPDDKLRALFAFVSTKVRYVSLAFGMGRFEPRAASQVLATEYGDCKDKHVLLASLARAIGLQVRPVLVSGAALLEERVPSPAQFDHVVSVWTRGGAGEWLWMDTTSGLLPPGALLQAHRDRKALLAGSAAASIVTSPASLPGPSGITIDGRGSLALDGSSKMAVTRRATGDVEYMMRAVFRDVTTPGLTKVAEGLAREDGIRNPTVATSRFTDEGPGQGVTLEYEVTHRYTLPTGKPWQMWVPATEVNVVEPPDDGEMELGEPSAVTLVARYEIPDGLNARPPVPVSIERPFARYSSTYRVDGRVLVIERRLETLARKLDASDVDAYRAFRKAVDTDYRQSFDVDALPASASPGSTADDLNAAGHKAIEDREYARAVDLLKRAVAAEPKHKSAWNNLGRAYIGTREFDLASEALERQIAISPYDAYAYANLGHLRRLQGRIDEAIASLQKQIEIAPLDGYSHAELGRIFAERREHAAAEEWFDRAVRLSPKEGDLWIGLGRARLELGRTEDALAAFDRGIEVSPTASTRNSAAWALAETGRHLDVAERHVRWAIESVTTMLAGVTAESAAGSHVQVAHALAAYWDTLGWVYFKRGELDKAEPWLQAAWQVSEDGEIAEHLGALYERRDNPNLAAQFYAHAAAADRPEGRKSLERLAAAAGVDVDSITSRARAELAEARITRLAARLASRGQAEFYLVVEGNRVSAARFISGDDGLESAVGGMIGATIPFAPPDDKPLRLIRRASVTCVPEPGCTLALLPSGTVSTQPPTDSREPDNLWSRR